jgi:hypothetical protein
VDVLQPVENIDVDVCGRLVEQIAQVGVGVDARPPNEGGGANKDRPIDGVATDAGEQCKPLQGLGKGSRGRGGVVGENPR